MVSAAALGLWWGAFVGTSADILLKPITPNAPAGTYAIFRDCGVAAGVAHMSNDQGAWDTLYIRKGARAAIDPSADLPVGHIARLTHRWFQRTTVSYVADDGDVIGLHAGSPGFTHSCQ